MRQSHDEEGCRCQNFIGKRVKNLPEFRLLVEASGNIAVKKICNAGNEKDQQSASKSPLIYPIEKWCDEQDAENGQ